MQNLWPGLRNRSKFFNRIFMVPKIAYVNVSIATFKFESNEKITCFVLSAENASFKSST